MRRTRVVVCSMLAASIAGAGVVTAGALAATARPGTQANPIKAKDAARGAYTPANATIRNTRTGVAIYFRSIDGLPHNATPVRAVRGAVARTSSRVFTLRLPRTYRGTLSFFCTIHPEMRGKVTVTG